MLIEKFRPYRRILLIEALLILVTLGVFLALHIYSEKNTLHVAAVVSSTEDNEIIELLNTYTESASIGNTLKKIEIHPYYDGGDPEKAREIARKIIDEDKFVAVLGHFNQKTSSAAAEIYSKAGMPCILPVSHSAPASEWIFQTSPSLEDYGIYIAHYIKKILKKDSVLAVQSADQNDADLVESFTKTFVNLGGQVKKFSLNNDPLPSATETEQILSEAEKTENSLLLLATQKQQTVQLIVGSKKRKGDIAVMAMDAALGNAFADDEENLEYPGCFSDGIYVPTVVLPNNKQGDLSVAYALEKHERKGKDSISQQAIKAVLSASFVTHALEEEFKPGKPKNDNLASLRKSVQLKIKNNRWFGGHQQGQSNKVIIGVFDHQYLTKAPINPITVKPGTLTGDDKLLEIGDHTLYPADVVHAGVSMVKISDIDLKKLTYNLEFFLWFRYRTEVTTADDVEFLNTLQYAGLLDIVTETEQRKKSEKKDTEIPKNTVTAELISKKDSDDGESYRCYLVAGRFKTINPISYTLGQQNVYVRFRNRAINRFKLNYVAGSANNDNRIYRWEDVSSSEKLKFDVIDNLALKLQYEFNLINDSEKIMPGAPERHSESNKFSQFIAEYRMQSTLLTPKGLLFLLNELIKKVTPGGEAIILLLSVSFGFFLFSLFYQDDRGAPGRHAWWWSLLNLLSLLFILLSLEITGSLVLQHLRLLYWGSDHIRIVHALMYLWEKGIAVLWWLIPAYYVVLTFDQFIWPYFKKKTGAEIPDVLRLFVRITAYTAAGLGIMAYVLQVAAQGLVATSGVIAIVIGIASKVDLSNVLAGLGISLSKAFKLGDWVKIDGVEGKVLEMTSRATRVQTFDASVVSIPNSSVSNAVIENFSRPDPAHRLIIHLETVPVYRFERVEKVLLDAVIATEGVLDNPKPFVIFKGQGDSCQIYEVAFFINEYSKRAVLWQAAWRRIWRHLEQAGIEMATPQREIFMPKPSGKNLPLSLTVMNNCGAFAGMSDKNRELLAEEAEFCRYQSAEIILRYGENSGNLFIITEGAVSLSSTEGKEKRLGVGEMFNADDLSDGTAAALTETELLIVGKEAPATLEHSPERIV